MLSLPGEKQSQIPLTSLTDSVKTSIGPNLASAIPSVNFANFCSFLASKVCPPIILKQTDTLELESICSLFSPRRVPGYYDISMLVIKHSFHLIFARLANIINLSLLKGIFPDKLKIRKLILFYKTKDPSLFSNIYHMHGKSLQFVTSISVDFLSLEIQAKNFNNTNFALLFHLILRYCGFSFGKQSHKPKKGKATYIRYSGRRHQRYIN